MQLFSDLRRKLRQASRNLFLSFSHRTYAISIPLLIALLGLPMGARGVADFYMLTNEIPVNLIQLTHRRPETYPYVLDYPSKKDSTFEIDLSDEIQPDEIPLFYQWDERWGYHIYGSGVLALTGCGPTSLSMVYSGITQKCDYDPLSMADWAIEHGYCVAGSGTAWSLMGQGAQQLGLTVQNAAPSESKILESLGHGKVIIALMGPGHFTDHGHFIVLTGLNDQDKVLINDPNSLYNSHVCWDASLVVSEMKSMWIYETT